MEEKKKAYTEEYFESYVAKLKKIDWYYSQSDDIRIWQPNSYLEKEIDKLQSEIDKDAKIYNQYSPWKIKK